MGVFSEFAALGRLFRMGRVLARHDALMELDVMGPPPLAVRAGRRMLKLVSGRAAKPVAGSAGPLAAALTELGPSHIKFGQFLATRRDIVGEELAAELAQLQDKLPPFAQDEALREIAQGQGRPVTDLFEEVGPPLAAASIAQVHRARTRESGDAQPRDVAVKVLRPGIEQRFARDMEAYKTAARLIERLYHPSRRLRPIAVVETMARSVELEMDLRLEAAAISEMAENTAGDADFSVPEVDWARTSRRILTTQWIDAVPLNRIDLLTEAGIDLKALADTIIRSFLRHAMRDGFFHADMHQGNLFSDREGRLIAVDFGIMGRLSPKDRMFLAEILHGFIHRNYLRISQVHFDAGYIPSHQSVETFAQALRAIGEPIMGRDAEDISMARLLGQLLQVTEQFDMVTQPQLILLQKTMVVVEGVARNLNPNLNMWVSARPVVEDWMRRKLGPEGRLKMAGDSLASVRRIAINFPDIVEDAGLGLRLIADMGRGGGIKLDESSARQLAKAQAREGRGRRLALWIGALSLAVLALMQLLH
ncbi:MAG: 2-polyprenylphenol 6-hydroxylase [Hyphomicrobiales bacterium]|nr:MAG: 2-polyprenylphenol 6-hydroxylase [Hyphomicrobiales bacterium]